MRRHRVHLSRTTIGVLLAIAFWLAAGAGALRLAQRPEARKWIARQLAARVERALATRMAIGEARITLLPPRMTLLDVAVGPAESPLLRAAVVEVGLSQLRLAERELVLSQLRLRGVRVAGSPPATTGGQGREPWLRLVVRQLSVEDLRIDRLDLGGGLALAAAGVEARWTGTTRHPVTAAVLRAESVRLQAPGLEPISGSLSAWGRRTAEGWEVRRLRAEGPWWSADVHGSVTGRTLRGAGRVAADLAALDAMLHAHAGLAGNAEAAFTAEVDGRSFRIDAGVRASRVSVATFAFEEVVGEAHLSPEGIEASLSRAAYAGGVVEGSYALGGFASPWPHRIAARGEGVAVAAFLAALGVDAAGLAGGLSFTADVAWDGARIKEGIGTGVGRLSPLDGEVPVAGQVVVALARDGALQLSAEQATLAGAPVRWEGRLSLGSWVPSWAIAAEKMPVPVIARLLRGWVGAEVLPPELSGEAAIDLRLRGPFTDLSVVGDVAVAPIAYAAIAADGFEGSLAVEDGVAALESGVLHVGGARVSCEGTLDFAHGNLLALRLGGRAVPLDRVAAWGGVVAPLAGRVGFTGTLAGTLERPSAEAALELAGVSLAGVGFGNGRGRLAVADGVITLSEFRVGPFAAEVAVDVPRREARVDATLAGFGLEAISPPLARLVGGALDCSFHGAFPFDQPSGRLAVASAGGASGTVELDRTGIAIDLARPELWRLAGHLRQVSGGFGGRIDFGITSWRRAVGDLLGGDLGVDGELAGTAALTLTRDGPAHADGEITALVLEAEGERAALASPARFSVVEGAVRLEGARLLGPRSSLFVRAARQADGTLAGNVAGEFPAALLSLLFRGGAPRGRVELLGEITGTDGEPSFEGVARVENGSITLPGLPAPLTAVNGVFEFVPEVIALSQVRFQLAGGEGVCDGRIIVSPALELDLTARAAGIRWPVAAGFTPSLQGTVRIVGPPEALLVSGQTTLQRTVYRRELSLQKLILEGLRAPVRGTEEEGAVRLNVQVAVPATLEVNMPLARLAARGEVRLVGSSARPGLIGRLEVLPGAEVEMSGTRYEIDRGTVTFNDPSRIEPFLDVVGHTTVQTWDITVGLLGTLDRLTPTFTSTPPLPEMDIIALLSTGRRVEEVGEAQAGAVASTFLTEQLTGAVTTRARSLLALDQLSVDPVAATETGNPSARLTLAKQVSRDWTVTVSTTLASNTQEVIVSRWRLSPGVFLEAIRDNDGSWAMEVKWQRRY